MKVSVNWLKQFTEIDLSVDELVQKIGAQLGAVEEVIDIGKKYQGAVIVRVVACEKHPNADKLSLCRIDDGGNTPDVNRDENGYIQVVCGAPNVRADMLVVWLPPGATVPSTYDKDPFVLEARELRGTVSNGMLASASELAISEDHSGIVEIDIDAKPGQSFAEAYELNDYVIDIENKMFTHRPDCFGILGVAREVAGIQGKAFKSPDWYLTGLDRVKPGKTKLPLQVKVENPELVTRFMAVAIADVTVKPSPLIIQTYLSRVGLRPINNIVDVTNYLMVLTGQPLHAYDYDKVKAKSGEVPTLVARKAGNGEKIALLNGKTLTFSDPAILITSDKEAIGVGGVMGGAETEVDEHTKNIILECANFDMYSIRRTSMKYGLFTDAVTRFNKGQSPLQNDRVIEEAVVMVESLARGAAASELIDSKGGVQAPEPVLVATDFINSRLGLEVPADTMAEVLRHVEFDVTLNEAGLTVTSPFWRTDIAIREDVVEEVGRLIGFDQLPIELPRRTIKPAARDELFDLKAKIRDTLSRFGANEVLTYSFVHGDLLDKVGQDKEKAFQLSNALSPDLQYYRLSLTPSLLEKIHPNIKAGYGEFAVFEIGKGHMKNKPETADNSLPKELNSLGMVYAVADKLAVNHSGAAYFEAKKYLTALLSEFGVMPQVRFQPLSDADLHDHTWIEQLAAAYEPTRSAVLRDSQNMIWGVVGEFKNSVKRSLKLPKRTAGFEVGPLLLSQGEALRYTALPKFPKVHQDISLKVASSLAYQDLFDCIWEELQKIRPDNCQVWLGPKDVYQGKEKDMKHITLRLVIASYVRTLTDQEVNALLDEIAAAAREKFGADRL
jgi:phenylalanyl-tRNA synthetase beta chain